MSKTIFWICNERLEDGGHKIMGPFVVKEYAFEMRGKLELLNLPITYWIDSEEIEI